MSTAGTDSEHTLQQTTDKCAQWKQHPSEALAKSEVHILASVNIQNEWRTFPANK